MAIFVISIVDVLRPKPSPLPLGIVNVKGFAGVCMGFRPTGTMAWSGGVMYSSKCSIWYPQLSFQ